MAQWIIKPASAQNHIGNYDKAQPSNLIIA